MTFKHNAHTIPAGKARNNQPVLIILWESEAVACQQLSYTIAC